MSATDHPSRAIREMLAQAPSGMRHIICAAYLEGGRDVLRAMEDAQCPVTAVQSRCRMPRGHAAAHEIGALGILDAELLRRPPDLGRLPPARLTTRTALDRHINECEEQMTRRAEALFVACLILAVTLTLMAILHTPLPFEAVRVWAETIAEGLR